MKPTSLWLCKTCEVAIADVVTLTHLCPYCREPMVKGFLKFNLETADFEVLDAKEVLALPGGTDAH